MSFGFGVGDFIAVTKVAVNVRRDFVGAPGQLKTVEAQVKALAGVLREIEDFDEGVGFSEDQRAQLDLLSFQCRGVLQSLEKFVDESKDVNSESTSLSAKSKRAWKKLKFDNGEVESLNRILVAQVAFLNAFYSKLNSDLSFETNTIAKDIRDTQERRERHDENEDERVRKAALLSWLTSLDYSTQQADNLGRRQDGTGKWLLESGEYQRWLEGTAESRILYCPGMPGAGKTIMSSIVIEDLGERFGDDPNTGVAYAFVNFRRQGEQTTTHLFCSFLEQLLRRVTEMPSSVTELHKNHSSRRTRPSHQEILEALAAVTTALTQSFIVIDGLDEYQIADGGYDRLITELIQLQSANDINLFTTSREIPGIQERFEAISIVQEIRASASDLELYMMGNMDKIELVADREDLQRYIILRIEAAVDGIFILAKLHHDSLLGVSSESELLDALDDLTQASEGTKAYDRAYQDAMARIRGQVPRIRILAERVLSWVICTKAPLKLEELKHALAVKNGSRKLDTKSFTNMPQAIAACAGLVVHDNESNMVRLVHYTAQEYFERAIQEELPQANQLVLDSCLAYLNFDIFAVGEDQPDDSTYGILFDLYHDYPFYIYAANHWHRHYLEVTESKFPEFLRNDFKVRAAIRGITYYTGMSAHDSTAIHLCAVAGLTKLVQVLIDEGVDPDERDWDGCSALQYASSRGHTALVEMLLARDDVNPSQRSSNRRTPLHDAARNGKTEVVRLLIAKGVDVNTREAKFWTPLIDAASDNRIEVMELLLEQPDIEVNAVTVDRESALMWAAKEGHLECVHRLLQRGDVQRNYRGCYRQRPLHYAVIHGHIRITRLFLDCPNINVNARDQDGLTPLHHALTNGFLDEVRMLLDCGSIRINRPDFKGQTPLIYAAGMKPSDKERDELMRSDCISTLMGRDDLDVTAASKTGRTALHWAAFQGRTEVVRWLIAYDEVDLNVRDQEGYSPLLLAIGNAHAGVVGALLSWAEVDMKSVNNVEQNAVHRAVVCGSFEILDSVLKTGEVELNRKDYKGRSPLIFAAGYTNVWNKDEEKREADIREAVEELLEYVDVLVDMTDEEGRTALSWAVERGREKVVELLLERPSPVLNLADKSGKTPLDYAVEHNHSHIGELLLNKGGSHCPDPKTPAVRIVVEDTNVEAT